MVSRKQRFLDLRELIDAAESNFDHGRNHIGLKKLAEALGTFIVLYHSLNCRAGKGVGA